jgi:hypothetical protein
VIFKYWQRSRVDLSSLQIMVKLLLMCLLGIASTLTHEPHPWERNRAIEQETKYHQFNAVKNFNNTEMPKSNTLNSEPPELS